MNHFLKKGKLEEIIPFRCKIHTLFLFKNILKSNTFCNKKFKKKNRYIFLKVKLTVNNTPKF